MAIKLDIQPYCESCCDFEADVTKPVKTSHYMLGEELVVKYTDTVVKCKYANRCANLMRYLTKKNKGE